ncbi:MAG: DMT family transporter [Pseudomonadota bacterium]
MEDLWIPITIAAAFFQNLRFMLQKTLTGRLSTLGVTFSRFLFAAPLAWVVVAGLLARDGAAWPGLTPAFAGFAAVGAVAQILATALLVFLFSLRNFAVGVTLSKTETVTTALLSAAILAEPVGPGAWAAIAVTVAGLAALSGPSVPGAMLGGLVSRAAAIGVAAGAIFAVASVGYRGASLALAGGDVWVRAAVTLAAVTTFQTVLMAAWLAWREPGQIGAVCAAWRVAVWVGVTGMLGSLGWFTAFTLQNAALVKALGQIEVVFTLAASVLVFRERLTRAEVLGIALIVGGIFLILRL